jgi:hypothetical protein
VTRAQAYKRLAVVAVAVFAIVLALRRDVLIGVFMAAAILASGFLAVELGLSQRRRRFPDQDDD